MKKYLLLAFQLIMLTNLTVLKSYLAKQLYVKMIKVDLTLLIREYFVF